MKHLTKFFLLIFLALVTFTGAQTLSDNKEAAQLYNDANKLSKAGNYQGALDGYEAAIKLAPADYRLFYQKGIVLKKLRKFDDAKAAFIKCTELDSSFSTAFNALGGIHFANGDYLKAVESFEKFKAGAAKESHKKRADNYIARAYTKLGMQEKTNGDYKQAENYLVKATDHFKYDAAFLALAEVYVETAQYNKALVAADNAINNLKKIPKGGPYYFKGMAFKGLNDKAKAIENLNIAKKDRKYKKLCEYELKHNLN